MEKAKFPTGTPQGATPGLTLYTLNQSLFAFNMRLPNGRRFLPSSESLPETGSRHLKTLSSYKTQKISPIHIIEYHDDLPPSS